MTLVILKIFPKPSSLSPIHF